MKEHFVLYTKTTKTDFESLLEQRTLVSIHVKNLQLLVPNVPS